MSDAVFMDFEEPHPFDDAPKARKPRAPREPKGKDEPKEPGKALIPRLPAAEPALTGDELRRGVSDRNRSAAKLKVKGFSYQEIADKLDFVDARAAKRAVESTIAATLSPDEVETQRAIVLARAEDLFRQSSAMAGADYLVLEDGEQVPNERKIQWHQQAATDLMNIATLTGAKAPTKVEFTPGEAEMDRLVGMFVRRAGHEDILDAEVIELDAIPSVDDDDEDVIRG